MIKVEDTGVFYNILRVQGTKPEVDKIMKFLTSGRVSDYVNGKYRIRKDVLPELQKIHKKIVEVRYPWSDIGSDMKLSPYLYQKETIYHVVNNLSSLLILPTGSGKTPIMIGIYLELLKRKITDKPAIIVVKASLKYQWLKEVSKFSDLRATVIETPAKKKKKFDSQFENMDLYILNYETLENDMVYEKLREYEPETILCDEIQYISNHKTNKAKAAYRFNDLKIRVGATATPITNNPENLFGLFNLIDKDLFVKYSNFSRQFLMYNSFRQVSGVKNKEVLMNKISPYIFMKKESDVSGQLPTLVINKIYCEMTPKLQEINECIMTDLENERLKNEELSAKLDTAEENEEFEKSKAKIMAYQTFAQELVNDPRLLSESDSDMSKKYSTKEPSPKLGIVINLIEDIIDENDKVCIFTKYERMQSLLRKEIEKKLKTKCAIVNGSMNAKERYRQAYDLFRDSDEHKVLIATSAMEEGISLSECRYLIEYDLAVSYASQTQRHGRVKRADSKYKTSYIYQIICKESWDEIQEKIISKKQKYDKEIIKSL